MKTVIGLMVALGLVLTTLPSTRAADGKISVVAAENFYGDVARQIGGDDVTVASIMNNPDQDPHLFETTPSTVRQIAAAQVVILNGADYDPWMDKLLKASPKADRTAIVVADLVGKKAGDNPHLWYDPGTMPAAAKALAEAFAKADPAHKDVLRRATQDLPRLAQADQRENRRHPRQVCRYDSHRERAGVRLHGERTRAKDAQ
jgi:zinc/manganese transport system substrate-binding protein